MYVKQLVHSRHSAFISSVLIHSGRKHIWESAYACLSEFSQNQFMIHAQKNQSQSHTCLLPKLLFPCSISLLSPGLAMNSISYFSKSNSLKIFSKWRFDTNNNIVEDMLWLWGHREIPETSIQRQNHWLYAASQHLPKRGQHRWGCHGPGMFIL